MNTGYIFQIPVSCCEILMRQPGWNLKTNLFCDHPFGHLIIPVALRRKTILAVGGTQMTPRGAAIGGRCPREGQVPTSKRLGKPELSTTHVCH